MRRINILLFTFIALTIFLIAVHIKKTVYFENPSGEVIERIFSGSSLISTYLKLDRGNYIFNISFSHITNEIVVKNLDVKLLTSKSRTSNLKLKKILPYSGMRNWDIPEYDWFLKIPDSLRKLSRSNNPYFAYDFIFSEDQEASDEKYLAMVAVNILDHGEEIHFTRELEIIKKRKYQIKAFDPHSDVSILLIPVFGIVSLVLTLIRIIGYIARYHGCRKNRVD